MVFLRDILQNNTVLAVHIVKNEVYFCFLDFHKSKPLIIEFSLSNENEPLSKEIDNAIEKFNPQKVIVGYDSGILSFNLSYPSLKKNLLRQSIQFQLEDLYPFEDENLCYAYHILEKGKTNLKIRGFIAQKNYFDDLVEVISDMEKPIDMLTTVEVAGKRIDDSLTFFEANNQGEFSFKIPLLDSFSVSWQEELSDDIKPEQVGGLILALYGVSKYMEMDKKSWFVLPKKLTKKIFFSKFLFYLCISSFIILLFFSAKTNYVSWYENQLYLNSNIKEIDDIEAELKGNKKRRLIAEEIIKINIKNEALNRSRILITLTKVLPVDYFVTSLSIDKANVTCRIETQETNILKPQFYQDFMEEKYFEDLQVSDTTSKGKYLLRFTLREVLEDE